MVSTWSFLFHSFFLSIYYVHIHAWICIYICIHITYIYIILHICRLHIYMDYTHRHIYIYMYTYIFTFEVLIGYLLTSSRALHTFPSSALLRDWEGGWPGSLWWLCEPSRLCEERPVPGPQHVALHRHSGRVFRGMGWLSHHRCWV
jgi:hypothetical protein